MGNQSNTNIFENLQRCKGLSGLNDQGLFDVPANLSKFSWGKN